MTSTSPPRAGAPRRLPEPRRVYLHVGLAKTGTTYLQQRLWANRYIAREHGLLYPGAGDRDQFVAVCSVQPERYPHWQAPVSSAELDPWDRLVAEMAAWPGTSVISHELLGSATAQQVERVLTDLSFAEVHLVCTVRDLGRQVPSVWQENVKNQYTVPFPDFVDEVKRCDPNDPRDLFWEFQDLPRILRTWGAQIAPERIHVVTVPPRGGSTDLLWERFAGVIGVDPAALNVPAPRDNGALSASQSELLRRINARLGVDIEWGRYEDAVRRRLVNEVFFQLPDRRPFTLSSADAEWVTAHTDRIAADIVDRGYDVVGNLADLRPSADPEADFSAVADDSDLVATAVDTITAMLVQTPSPAVPAGNSRAVRRLAAMARDAARTRLRALVSPR